MLFGRKRGEVTRGARKCDEKQKFCSASGVVRVMGWRTKERKNATRR